MFTDLFEDLCFSEHLKSGCDKTWEGGVGGGTQIYTCIKLIYHLPNRLKIIPHN